MQRISHRQWFWVLTVCAFLPLGVMIASRASAQTVTGSIYGTVADPSGAIIPNATVTVINVDTQEAHTTKSSGSGAYVFPVLGPGTYKVSAKAPGFKTVIQNNVRLAANQNADVSFAMTAGAVQTTVTVEAGTTLVDTRESTISTTIDQQRVQDLPLVDRNPLDLVTLVPGVTNYDTAAPSLLGSLSNFQFSSNGLPANYNSYYLDGSYDTALFRGGGNLLPNPDALSEFSILTSNQGTEFGRYPGAVVNAITRSGNNQFHGVAYDFLRNTIFNTKSYFDNVVTPLHYNIFGAGVGGPAIRDKLFFFLSYQGTADNTDQTVPSTAIVVPSALEREGDFAQSTKKPTKTGCAAGQKPVAPATICMDPVAAALLQYIPQAVTSVNGVNYPAQQNGVANTEADQGVARLDYQLNPAHKLQFTFFQSHGTVMYPNGNHTGQIFDYGGANYDFMQSNYIVGDTWIISPHAVNSFRGTYVLNHIVAVPSIAGARLANLGSTIPEGDPQGLSIPPSFNVTGYWIMGNQGSEYTTLGNLTYGINDNLDYTHGRHSAKFGGELIENRFPYASVNDGSTMNTANGSYTGNALADFEEGHMNKFTQDSGLFARLYNLDPSLYAQDDWRLTHRLTLNLGVRWEVFYPWSGQGQDATFVPGVQSQRFPTAPLGLVFNGDPGIPDGIAHASYLRFAPRIGFADDVWGNGRMSLRGGYGIYYSINPPLYAGDLRQEPFTLTLSLSSTSSIVDPYTGISPYNGVSPFGTPFNPASPTFESGATLYSLDPHTSATPYVQEYNLAIEQQLATNWSMQIAYVGNTGRKFLLARDENSAVYAPGATTSTANIQSRRPYQPEGEIDLFDNILNNNYNSLQASITRQFSHGFSLLANYVWSKALDTEDPSPAGGAGLTLANEYDPAMDYGLSINDIRQSFVASYLYALPDVMRWGLFGKEALSGWQINGITTLQKGTPFNVLSNVDTNFDGVQSDRPNTVGNPSLGSGRSRAQKVAEYFNTAAFAVPPTGQLYGNTQRNSLIGPGYVDTDLSAFKKFALPWENSDLLFRGEAFNLFGNVNLNAPGSTLGTATYGVISGSGPGRIVQFALKYEF